MSIRFSRLSGTTSLRSMSIEFKIGVGHDFLRRFLGHLLAGEMLRGVGLAGIEAVDDHANPPWYVEQ